MDLAKLRSRCNHDKIQRFRFRSKCLSFNVLTLPHIPTKQEIFSKQLTQRYFQQSPMSDQIEQQDKLKTLQDEQTENRFRNNKLYLYFIEKTNPDILGQSDSIKLSKLKSKQQNKIMASIVQVSEQKYEKKKYKTQKLQTQLSNLYQQNHKLYTIIRQKGQQKWSRKFHWLKQIIEKMELDLQTLKQEKQYFQQQIVNFLRLLLRGGYYRKDGVSWMFSKLVKFNYKICKEDFPSFLDKKSMNYLIGQYQSMQQLARSKQFLPKIKLGKRTYRQFQNITDHSQLKRVYQSTKQYIGSMLGRSLQKSMTIHSPSNCQTTEQTEKQNFNKFRKNAREAEIKRLKQEYPKDKHQKIIRYMIGEQSADCYIEPLRFITRRSTIV